MTTIAALAVHGGVFMAADSLTNIYERPMVDAARKLRRVPVGADSEALFGVCGDGALCDMISYRLTLDDAPGHEPGDVEQWAATVADAVTQLAVESGLTDGGRLDGGLLLGYRGRLWHLTHAQAIPIPDGVAALGSGEGPAIGALDVLMVDPACDPVIAVRRACEIGCARDKHSRAPIYVEQLPAGQEV